MEEINTVICKLIKSLIVYAFIGLFFFKNGWSNELEIENISLNQKLSSFVKDLNKFNIHFDYPNKKFANVILDRRNYKLDQYDRVSIFFEWRDENKLVKSVTGFKKHIDFESCIRKKDLVLKDIYKNFVNDIGKVVEKGDSKFAEGIQNYDVIYFKNSEEGVVLKCYDYYNSKFVNPSDKVFFTVEVTTKKFQDWLLKEALSIDHKNKLNEFKIEKFSINQSLLNFYTKNEIKSLKKIKRKNDSKRYLLLIYDNLENYNQVSVIINNNDSKYNIKGINGTKFFGSTNKCLKEKDELFEHLLEYLDTSIDRIVRMPFQLPSNSKNDKTYLTTDFFFYENRNEISITCQRSEIEPRVGFTVSFFSKELRGF